MKTVNLKVVTQKSLYNQNPQTSEIKFSLLKRKGRFSFEELHYHVQCREYFGDTLFAAHLDKDLPTIYGFSLRGKRMSLDETIFSISLPNSPDNNNGYTSFIRGLKLLRNLEKIMGIPLKNRSKYYLTDKKEDNNDKLVVVSPKEWSYSTLLISLYTFILRLTTYKVNETLSLKKYMREVEKSYNGNDVGLINRLDLLDINFLLKNYKEILGSDSMTGLDDVKIGEFAFDYSDYCRSIDFNYDLSDYGKSVNQIGSWSMLDNHNLHGILNFNITLALIKKQGYNIPPRFNYKWAVNYSKLKGIA